MLWACFFLTHQQPVCSFPHRKRMAATELSKSMNEFLTKLQDDLKEAMNTMMCTKCEGKHKYVSSHAFVKHTADSCLCSRLSP